MTPEEFLQTVIGCKDYLLARASEHEQAACYARYVHDFTNEAAECKEQKTLLHWASALDFILEGNNAHS